MSQRRSRSPLAVVVLGMLSEEPLHGYAMRQRLGERAYDRLPGVKASSLYDAVRRMDAAGLIRADETGRAGNRPDRTRFVLTPDGREALDAWIEESLADDTDPDALPAALSFMYPLGSSRVIQVLRGRLERMSTALRMDDEELRHADAAAANPIFLSEHRYQLARRRAERDWLASFVAALEQSELTWPDAKPAATSTE